MAQMEASAGQQQGVRLGLAMLRPPEQTAVWLAQPGEEIAASP
jgi:hypothetical protein